MKAALGIDAGASSVRWCLVAEDGLELAQGVAPPLTGHIFNENERNLNLGRLRAVLAEAASYAPIGAVVGGITGLHRDSAAQRTFIREAAHFLNLNREQVYFDNDLHLLYAALFKPGEGVVLYAGTGAVAYHETAQGMCETAGGYGYLIDDAGAGFWLGQRALRWLLREQDRYGVGDSPLSLELYKCLGSSQWQGIMEHVYKHGREGVAALVPAIVSAATQGDEVALELLAEAAKELAQLLKRLQGRLGQDLPVAFAGGISQSEQVVTALRLELAPLPLEVVSVQADEVAARLALKRLI